MESALKDIRRKKGENQEKKTSNFFLLTHFYLGRKIFTNKKCLFYAKFFEFEEFFHPSFFVGSIQPQHAVIWFEFSKVSKTTKFEVSFYAFFPPSFNFQTTFHIGIRAFTREGRISLIKVAYFMLIFLNLKSFISHLFFWVAFHLSILCWRLASSRDQGFVGMLVF